MALLTPLYMQPASGDAAITYPAQQDRAALLAAVFSREGVLDVVAGQLAVTQRAAGANFSVDVAAGRAAIVGDDISDQGTYLCTSTTTVNLTVPAKPASGSRTHRVVARVRDKLSNGVWTSYDWTIELLADTGSGTPAQPASAITLALITVSSSTVSIVAGNIADQRSAASVGTPARTGTWTVNTAAYAANDATRPLRWSVNPDGWVQLGGWIRRTAANVGVTARVGYVLTDVPLPAAILPNPSGFRDFAGMSSLAPMQYTIRPDGHLTFVPFADATLVQNSTWFSFDGCGYRL